MVVCIKMGFEAVLLGKKENQADIWEQDSTNILGELSPVWEVGLLGLKGMEMGEEIAQ